MYLVQKFFLNITIRSQAASSTIMTKMFRSSAHFFYLFNRYFNHPLTGLKRPCKDFLSTSMMKTTTKMKTLTPFLISWPVEFPHWLRHRRSCRKSQSSISCAETSSMFFVAAIHPELSGAIFLNFFPHILLTLWQNKFVSVPFEHFLLVWQRPSL
jgi:hypothetical protein